MNFLRGILFVFFVISAYPTAAKPSDYCHECVHYNFEQGFSSLFSDNGICSGLDPWVEGKYSSIDVKQPHENSESFITPSSDFSCSSSFPFVMSGGGTVHVKVFIDSANSQAPDQFYVFVEQVIENGNNPTMGYTFISSKDPGFVYGWQTVTLTLEDFKAFDGQLNIMGFTNQNSTILVDSFCYKPSHYKGECWADDIIVTVPETTTVTDTTTPEVTNPTAVTETTTAEVTNPTAVTETTTAEVTSPTSVTETSTAEVTSPTSVTEITTAEVTNPTTVTETKPTTSADTNGTEDDSVIIIRPTTPIPTIIVPEPTIPTPSIVDRCPDDPFIHWLLPHEDNCNLFYYCVWGSKVLHECPSGLHFNRVLQVCDWPMSAKCTTT